MKLKTKVILIFTTLITLAFGLMMTFIVGFVFNSNQKMIKAMSTQLFESKAQEASDWISQRINELQIIALDPSVQKMDDQAIQSYVEMLNQDVGQRYGNQWGTFAIGGLDGIGYVAEGKTIDISGRDYFIEAMKTREPYILSTPVNSKTDEALISLICYPLRNERGTYGFINGAITLNRLTELVNEIDFYQGESWIMDSGGQFYSQTDEAASPIDLNKLLNQLNENQTQASNHYQGQEYTYYYTKIPGTVDWYLCTRVTTAYLMKETNTLLMSLVMMWLLLLVITLVACITLSKTITTPIENLSKTMQKAGNDLSIQATVKGNDEVAVLAQSFNQMIQKTQLLMNQSVQSEKEKRKSELRILQAQINPHFLYNTLDSLHWMAYDHEDKEMLKTINALSNFYRISLSKGDEFIPVARELEHVRYYLQIQSVRFEGQFDVTMEIDPSITSFIMLKILLQPIVENAIQHGIKPADHPCFCKIVAKQENDHLIFIIEDNGVGMDTAQLQTIQNALEKTQIAQGFGLFNVHQRIKLTYGSPYGLRLESHLNQGTKVIVTLPIIQENSHVENTNL